MLLFVFEKMGTKCEDKQMFFPNFIVWVPQCSILGPLLINVFINDLYLLFNFTDDNTISTAENTIEKLISTLEQDSQAAIDWFKVNEINVNLDKFQAIPVMKNW